MSHDALFRLTFSILMSSTAEGCFKVLFETFLRRFMLETQTEKQISPSPASEMSEIIV